MDADNNNLPCLYPAEEKEDICENDATTLMTYVVPEGKLEGLIFYLPLCPDHDKEVTE